MIDIFFMQLNMLKKKNVFLNQCLSYVHVFYFQPDLRTNSDCVAEWQGNIMKTKLGNVTCKSLKSSPIK